MSAAAREASGSIPYGSSPGGGGGGAGGKFLKKPYRRSHAATPYDRPPSSIRNFPGFLSVLGEGSGTGNDGWLRRIVDPAQRLIAAGAQKLFASVLQKRLTQPPPPQPPEKGPEAQEKHQEAVTTRSSREHQGAIREVEKATSTNDDSSLVNLEKILTQRTFSKPEIDRLTALLHARTLDSSVPNEVKRPEGFSSGPHDLKDGRSSIMQKADGNENQLLITRVNGLDGNVASPAELAKAYMGARASTVGPSGLREDSLLMTGSQQTPKLPVMSLISTSSNQRFHENGYITPRSRGRSAIYSMARTPYARVRQTTPLKILEPMSEHGDGRSVTPQASEPGRISGSNALKRRSSIFENDIGSVGPLRRIRHKPNLSSPRNNSLLSSSSAARRLAPLPSANSDRKFTDQSVGNEGIAVPSRNVPSISSKSNEIASKILEQLDKIASPPKERSSVVRLASLRDKAPVKLLPSDLRGRALKSLEHIDSSKYLEIARGSSKLDDSVGTPHQDSRASALLQIDKVEQNGPSRTPFDSDELPPTGNHLEITTVERDAVLNDKVVDLDETIPLVAPSAPINRTFRMSAHEDYVDLDDDDQRIEAISTSPVDDGDKLESTTLKRALTTEADAKDEPVPVSEVHVPAFGLKERKAGESPFIANSGEKTVTFGFPSIPPTRKNVEPDVQVAPLKPVPDTSTSERPPSVVSSVFTFGKEASSGNDEKPPAPAFAFVNNGPMTEDADRLNGSSTTNFTLQSSLSGSSSSFFATSVGPVTSVAQATELNKVDDKKDPSPGVLETSTPASLAASTTSSTTNVFKFGIPTGPATASQPGFSLAAESNAPPPERPANNLPSIVSSGSGGSDDKSSPSQPVLAFDVQAPPVFKFGSTTATSSETPAVAPVEVQNKVDLGLVNAVGDPFSASSSADPSTVSSIFGFTAPASIGASSNKQMSVSLGVSNGPSQVLATTSGSGLSSSTQTVPSQFGSSAPSFAFGLAGNTNTLSGSSLFGSSAAVKFSTGTSLGIITSSLSAESTVVSTSSTTTTSNVFGSLQTTAAPVFGTIPSSTSPSTGFSFGSLSSTGPISFGANAASSSGSIFGSFGASASSNGPSSLASSSSLTTSSVAPLFGSTASTSSPTPAFTFGASTAGSPPQPIFGNSNPVFSFGQTSTGNNDQMNAEDSMAEDTIPAASPPVSIFGQQQISPAPPSSNFVFGSGANPFQFGGQQNFVSPPNPSPFGASGSLDFNASGGSSFSLGTGGGDKSGRKIVKVKHRQRRK